MVVRFGKVANYVEFSISSAYTPTNWRLSLMVGVVCVGCPRLQDIVAIV